MGEDVWEEFDQRRLIPQVGRHIVVGMLLSILTNACAFE
jgi:hypothetical protein